jgi:hypothetical protein
MYRYTLFLTSALVGGQRHAPAALPRERPGTHCTRGWEGSKVGQDGCGKSRLHRGYDIQTVQLVASRYNDCALPARPILNLGAGHDAPASLPLGKDAFYISIVSLNWI